MRRPGPEDPTCVRRAERHTAVTFLRDSKEVPTPLPSPPPWYSSFYWRIGISFVLFVFVVLVAQSLMFSYMMARSAGPLPHRSPNTLATIVAADVGSILARAPDADLSDHLRRQYGEVPLGIYVVTRDGRIAANAAGTLPDEIRLEAVAALAGQDPRQTLPQPRAGGPVVTAPIQVANELRGMVVMPPPPGAPGALREFGRLLSLPGTLLLVAVTALAAVVIFAPARRRLRALEDAAARLGAGDLQARAPEAGRDEIARVAHAFNRMAAELAARAEALRTADRLRRQMFADVSHELKTPLTTMRGYLETLHMPDVALDASTRERYLTIVQRETSRLERLVSDLLDLARFENAVAPFDIRVFDIERVFDHVVERHERDAGSRGINLQVHIGPSGDQLVGDPGRIEQVIDNLVTNALRYTPGGGTIELHAATVDGSAHLSVIDSGVGIAPEHLQHVFDRFYKVDASRTGGASAGSGLGLSIAKAIVERHGGTIDALSRPGRTEFRIVLPGQSASANL